MGSVQVLPGGEGVGGWGGDVLEEGLSGPQNEGQGRAGGKIAKLLLSFEDWAWSGSPRASEQGISMDSTCHTGS